MITEELKARMREVTARYPEARSGMLPCLHMVQDAEGAITSEGMLAVAEAIGVKADEVESIVSFYSMYHRQPVGKFHLKVCTSIACYLRGCDDLVDHFERRLGVKKTETSADGLFTLDGTECLAACGMAPAMLVNNEFVENVDEAKADELLARLRRGDGIDGLGGAWRVWVPGQGVTTTPGANGTEGKHGG